MFESWSKWKRPDNLGWNLGLHRWAGGLWWLVAPEMPLHTERWVSHTETVGMPVGVRAAHPTLYMYFILLVCPAFSFSSSAVGGEHEWFGVVGFGPCCPRLLEELFSADSRGVSRGTKSIWGLKKNGANTLQWFQSLITILTPYWSFLLNAINILPKASGLFLVCFVCVCGFAFLFCCCGFFLKPRNKLQWLENYSDLIQIARLC